MNFPTITKIKNYLFSQPKKPVVKVFHRIDGSFSLWVRKPTKYLSMTSSGRLLDKRYSKLEEARKAAREWYFRNVINK